MIRTYSIAVALALAAPGCGLIDPDITNFDLSMPERTFQVDTDSWQLTSMESFPEIACADNAGLCSVAISDHCGADQFCFGSCDGSHCKVKVLVALFTEIDLFAEHRELEAIDERPLVTITIDKVTYEIVENTFNVFSPPLTMYVGPRTVMLPGDPQARAVGTIPSIAAGTTVGVTDVELTADGRDALRQYMREYRTPFNVIIGSELDIEAGDLVPQGRLVAKINVTAFAGI
jgi:hypothetical protein